MRRDAEMDQTLTENEETDCNTTESTDKDNQDVQLPAKRFKHLERVSELLDKEDDKQENEENNTTQMSKAEQQLNQYIECRIIREENRSI